MNVAVRNTAAILVVALLVALGVALSSPADAQAGSFIRSEDIVNQTIRSVDIGKGGVASSEVRNQSLESWDLNQNSVGFSELKPSVEDAINTACPDGYTRTDIEVKKAVTPTDVKPVSAEWTTISVCEQDPPPAP